MSIDKASNWSIYNVMGIDWLSLYPETPYISPTPDKIPLVALNPIPEDLDELVRQNPSSDTNELLRVMIYASDCGCNAVVFGGSIEQTEAQLKAVSDLANGLSVPESVSKEGESEPTSSEDTEQKAGTISPRIEVTGPKLGVLLRSELLTGTTTECVHFLDNFRENKFVKGWFVMDEPHHWDWGNVVPGKSIDQEYNNLTLGYKTALMYGKGISGTPVVTEEGTNEEVAGTAEQLTMFNLPASDLQEWIGTCTDYEEYLKVMNLLFRPALWSLRCFPFTIADSELIKPTDLKTNHKNFYTYLKYYQGITFATGKPFWSMCQVDSYKISGPTGSGDVTRYPVPDTNMLRFQAFSALAYGAQGLIFSQFGMRLPSTTDTKVITPLEAPLRYDLKKGRVTKNTAITDAIKTVANEINACSRAFLGATCMSVGHCGTTYGQPSVIFPFANVTSIYCSGSGVLCSRLIKAGKSIIVLVNHEVYTSQTIGVGLKETSNIVWQYITPSSTKETTDVKTNNKISTKELTITLPPAGVAIFEFGIDLIP